MSATVEIWSHCTFRLFLVEATRQKLWAVGKKDAGWKIWKFCLYSFLPRTVMKPRLPTLNEKCIYMECGPSNFRHFLNLTGFIFLLTPEILWMRRTNYPQHWHCILFVEESFFSSCFKYKAFKIQMLILLLLATHKKK